MPSVDIRAALLAAVLTLALLVSFAAARKSKLEAVDLMLLLNGTKNYYTQTSLSATQVEAEWALKRHRMLAGGMTIREKELYVSVNKAPVFIIGAMKGLQLLSLHDRCCLTTDNKIFRHTYMQMRCS